MLVAVAAALVIYLIGVRIVRVMMAPAPPDEPDLSRLKPVDYRYRCMVCGTEVTMTATPEPDPDPDGGRHCRRGHGWRGARCAPPLPGGHAPARYPRAVLTGHRCGTGVIHRVVPTLWGTTRL